MKKVYCNNNTILYKNGRIPAYKANKGMFLGTLVQEFICSQNGQKMTKFNNGTEELNVASNDVIVVQNKC